LTTEQFSQFKPAVTPAIDDVSFFNSFENSQTTTELINNSQFLSNNPLPEQKIPIDSSRSKTIPELEKRVQNLTNENNALQEIIDQQTESILQMKSEKKQMATKLQDQSVQIEKLIQEQERMVTMIKQLELELQNIPGSELKKGFNFKIESTNPINSVPISNITEQPQAQVQTQNLTISNMNFGSNPKHESLHKVKSESPDKSDMASVEHIPISERSTEQQPPLNPVTETPVTTNPTDSNGSAATVLYGSGGGSYMSMVSSLISSLATEAEKQLNVQKAKLGKQKNLRQSKII